MENFNKHYFTRWMVRAFHLTGVIGLLCLGLTSAYSQTAYPDGRDLQDIRALFRKNGLPTADVKLATDRRVELIGSYQDRREVQVAFSLAQQVVGVRRVAPTTPQQIEYPIGDTTDAFRDLETKRPIRQLPVARNQPRKFAVIVGIKEFKSKKINSLTYTTRDAEALRDYLVSPQGGNFAAPDVTLLEDRQATKANIEKALDTLAANARPGDTVIVYFSTHGAPPNDKGNMGIVAYDTEVEPRQKIFETSITDDKITSFLDTVKHANVMVVLDTCFSGAAFSKVPGFLASGSKDLFVEEDRAVVQGVSQSSLLNLASGGKDLVTVTAARGATPSGAKILLSASDAEQRSWESERLKGGFFTYHFIEGLRSQRNVADAYDYAKPVVTQEVQREKHKNQTPQAVFIPRDANIKM